MINALGFADPLGRKVATGGRAKVTAVDSDYAGIAHKWLICSAFVYSDGAFDIHYVDADGKEVPLDAVKKK